MNSRHEDVILYFAMYIETPFPLKIGTWRDMTRKRRTGKVNGRCEQEMPTGKDKIKKLCLGSALRFISRKQFAEPKSSQCPLLLVITE
jgi:hypothetical protein